MKKLNKTYVKFTNDRDKFLEQILLNVRKDNAKIFSRAFYDVLKSGVYVFSHINDHNRFTHFSTEAKDIFENEVKQRLRQAVYECDPQLKKMQKACYIVSYHTVTEVIARLKGERIEAKTDFTPDLNELNARMIAQTDKLAQKLTVEFQIASLKKETVEQFKERMKLKLPARKLYKKPPPEMKRLKEAVKIDPDTGEEIEENPASAALDLESNEVWDEIISLYKSDELPADRGSKETLGEDEVYEWEVENEVAENFVDQIKDGEIDGAEEQGITDFIWIAVLDDKTREEHRLKHGLTSEEIAEKLDEEWDYFEDHSIVAPGGFGCRCRSAPYFKDLPDEPAIDYGDFNSWLNAA